MLSPALIVVVVVSATYGAYVFTQQKQNEHALKLGALVERQHLLTQLRATMAESNLILFRALLSRVQGASPQEEQWLKEDALRRIGEVERFAAYKVSDEFLLPQEQSFLNAIRETAHNYVNVSKETLQDMPHTVTEDSSILENISAHFVAVESSLAAWNAYKTAADKYLKHIFEEELEQTVIRLSIFVGFTICCAFALTLIISRHISKPIHNVVDVMRHLANGDHNVPVLALERKDEIGNMMSSVAAFQAKLQTLNEQAVRHDLQQLQAQLDLQQQIDKLEESEQRLRDIAESTSDWFWETDANDCMTMVSQRFYDVTGLDPAQIIGSRRLDYAKPAKSQDDASEWVQYAKQITQHKSFKNLDYRIKGADGREVCIRASGTPYFDSNGNFIGYRGASTDITALVRIQEELENSRNHLLGITSNLFEGVLLLAMDGEILFANPSAHRLLMVEQETLSGRQVDEVLRLVINGQETAYKQGPMHRAFAARDTIVDENATLRLMKNGEKISVAYACSAIMEHQGVPAVVVSFRSIEALKAAQQEALQASRLASVGQLAAGIAHEINTPIQYVGDNIRFFDSSFRTIKDMLSNIEAAVAEKGASDELKAELANILDEADAEYLMEELPDAARQSLDGVEHVAKIVRSMKEFSHPGSGASKIMTDINHAIENTLIVSTNEWKHNAIIEKDLADDLPQVLCLPAEINQVLLNIIVNASHALAPDDASRGSIDKRAQRGTIRISTRRDGEVVEIRIADNGPGIPHEIREHIFDPFFTTKPVGKGTGQGLTISFDVVVTKHSGQLLLEETPGGGATFVIRLPIEDPKAKKEKNHNHEVTP